MTIGIFLFTMLWAVFQWRDPTPPPVLDQILVATFGVWFASEAIDKKNGNSKRNISIDKVTELPDKEDPRAFETGKGEMD